MFGLTLTSILLAGAFCAMAATIPAAGDLCAPQRHFVAKEMQPADKDEWASTHGAMPEKFEALYAEYVPQLKSHCGAASSVICINSMAEGSALTQDSFFDESTTAIIQQETVFKRGFSLNELYRTLQTRDGFSAEKFQAGTDDGSVDVFREQLALDRENPNTRVIINFSRDSIAGKGEGSGHFSPVWDFDAANDRVLMLEVNAKRPHYWVAVEDMYSAMCASAGTKSRGWIVLTKEAAAAADLAAKTAAQ